MKKIIIASKSSPLARGVAGGTRRGVAKKFIVAITLALCAFGVRAENETQIATSMGYVTEELETRQDKFQKLGADTAMTYSGTIDGAVGSRTITGDLGAETNTTNTALPTVGGVDTKLDNKQDELDFAANTVLMNTGTAGAPAAKGIYDDSGSYVEQTDSLIEAATFNAALQTAINSEFTCAQRKDPNDPNSKCLLFNIFSPVNPSRNLFDPSRVPHTFYERGINNGDGTFTITAMKNNSYYETGKKLSQLVPDLIVGKKYTLSFTTTATSKIITLAQHSAEGGVNLVANWQSGTSMVMTEELLDAYFAFQAPPGATTTISNIQIEEGTTATPYQPYGQNTFIPQNVQ